MSNRTSPIGAVVKLYVDLPRPVRVDDIIETRSGRCYRVMATRVQQRGKHTGRQYLQCVVLGQIDLDILLGPAADVTIHRIRWYRRTGGAGVVSNKKGKRLTKTKRATPELTTDTTNQGNAMKKIISSLMFALALSACIADPVVSDVEQDSSGSTTDTCIVDTDPANPNCILPPPGDPPLPPPPKMFPPHAANTKAECSQEGFCCYPRNDGGATCCLFDDWGFPQLCF